jgi:hypothetical protein
MIIDSGDDLVRFGEMDFIGEYILIYYFFLVSVII